MIHSLVDDPIGEKEFEMLVDQDHFDDVWSIMKDQVEKYAADYFDGISQSMPITGPQENYLEFVKALIKQNDKIHDKYLELFDISLMDEYAEDVDGFKNSIIKKECDVIRNTLSSKSEALNEWKGKFYSAKGQSVYDTFYNIIDFANDYVDEMDEDLMQNIDAIDDNRLVEMDNNACYLLGVLGYGIVSNILNHMYPRVFPGNYKAGIFSLHFLTGKKGQKGINMPSETSEFCMIKDDMYSKTGIIEEEHNYYYPYQTFGLYTLRIYRVLSEMIKERYDMEFPDDFRFLLTNDFYNYVTSVHRMDIQTMTGNDDMLKFSTIW